MMAGNFEADPRSKLTDADSAISREQLIRAHAIGMLYQSLPLIMVNLTLMPAVVAVVMWDRVNHAVLLLWVLLTVLLLAARFVLAQAYRRAQPTPQLAPRWARYFTWSSFASGLLWGAAGMLFFVEDSIGHQVFLFTCIIGLTAGSIIATSYWLPSYYAYAVPAVSMVALRLAVEPSAEYRGLAVNQKNSALDALRLRFENLDLVQQLREQKTMAENANIAKSRFLAAASHDLRQPLHALGLFVGALDERIDRLDASARSLVSSIKRSVTALEGLFNALLDISKLDAGVVRPKWADFSLARLFEHLSTEFGMQARAKGLNWECHGADLVVRSDPVLLETILRNLLSNAIRYTPQGKVSLRATAGDARVHIEVEDTGLGIAAEHRREIFREFHQLHNPERDRSKGLGLGLAIVERLTRLLDHGLSLDSQPGSGSRFRVSVPEGDRAAAASVEPAGQVVPAALAIAGAQVVVIDDEAEIREGMKVLLEAWGYRVNVAGSAQEAVSVLSNAAVPDVIIADYRLRDEQTGVDAIRVLREHFRRPIPAFLVSGDTAPERLREVQASGFALLHKPVEPAKLRALLRNILR